ncbi:MAG: DUF1566 domain-containing protein [Deltaproteobacteria bacterium]|nr:DUF1566 domain-containing protein [Deltaproteobacteria bacterium]
MKRIIGILLIGFLGFLGCSDNDDTTTTVDQAVPVAPFGIMDTMTPTYEWTPVQYANRYHLLVQNVAEETIIDEWFTAEGTGYDSEEDLYMVTPEVEIIGAHTWKVLACLGGNCGLWSDTLSFSFNVMGPPQERFIDNGDGTVTDNNTEFMWQKDARGEPHITPWYEQSIDYCASLTFANRSDWRLPSLTDFKTIIKPHEEDGWNQGPALPPDMVPLIQNPQNYYYWTSTDYGTRGGVWKYYARQVHMFTGYFSGQRKARVGYVWCVRGGN